MTNGKPESLRLFFALWPDNATATALQQLQASMQGRIIPYANLHLTLAFLGQQPASLLAELKDILYRLPRTEIVLNLDRLGYFPRNRIAWVGTRKPPDSLLALHQQLIHTLEDRKVTFNGQHDYKPHITLARDASLPPDLAFDPIPWRANHAALVQSTTTAEGSLYQILASRSLEKDVWVQDECRQDDLDTAG